MFKSKTARGAAFGLLFLLALALPMQANADARVPVKGTETGTFKVVRPCATSGVVLEVTGSGHATHLGHYSGFYRECLDPATGAVTGGTFTLTAADGDTIFGTFSGQAVPTDDPDVVNYEDPGVITGGTGRFADARGRVTTSGLANLATGEYRGTIVGRMR